MIDTPHTSSTERDELGRIIGAKVITRASMAEVADTVMAAGYRRARVITTLDELKALPFGSIIRGRRHYEVACFEDDSEHGWAISGNRGARQASDFESWLPVTVIAEGMA